MTSDGTILTSCVSQTGEFNEVTIKKIVQSRKLKGDDAEEED